MIGMDAQDYRSQAVPHSSLQTGEAAQLVEGVQPHTRGPVAVLCASMRRGPLVQRVTLSYAPLFCSSGPSADRWSNAYHGKGKTLGDQQIQC